MDQPTWWQQLLSQSGYEGLPLERVEGSVGYALRAWKPQLDSDVLSATIVYEDILDAEFIEE